MIEFITFLIANIACYATSFMVALFTASLGMFGATHFTGHAVYFYWFIYTVLTIPLVFGTYNGLTKLLSED